MFQKKKLVSVAMNRCSLQRVISCKFYYRMKRLYVALLLVEVYKWIILALSISSDFWLRWLVHEA
jgi:hypothetical protein